MEIDEAKFWDWCIDHGYHNEDWVLDNLAELHEAYEESLDE
jgi:hypothetical protein